MSALPSQSCQHHFWRLKKAILIVASEKDSEADAENFTELALVVRADQEKVLLFLSGTTTPTTVSFQEFANDFETSALLAYVKDKAPNDEDAPQESLAFGIKWFLPEITRH